MSERDSSLKPENALKLRKINFFLCIKNKIYKYIRHC